MKLHYLHLFISLLFRTSYTKSTSLINKKLCFKNSHFLIQDILNSYQENGGSLNNLGLFIEYPFKITYKSLSDAHSNTNRQYISLSVNGNKPKTVLHVRYPYDRYMEYIYVQEITWTTVLYDSNIIPRDVSRVIVQSTIFGYQYKDRFLCLESPMLNQTPKYNKLNTECILNCILDQNPNLDERFDVIETYHDDSILLLHKVKHKEIPYNLWCMSIDERSPTKKFPKRAYLPEFV